MSRQILDTNSTSGRVKILAYSRQPLNEKLVPGDQLLRFATGEGVHYSAMIISERLESAKDLCARGCSVESAGPGGYVEVSESQGADRFSRTVGRRLTDQWGRVAWGQLVFRENTFDTDDKEQFAETPAIETITQPSAPLFETIGIDDISGEMDGLQCRFLQDVNVRRASGGTRQFSRGSVEAIENWSSTGADATIQGVQVSKLVIEPHPAGVDSVRKYKLSLSVQRRSVSQNAQALREWLAREGEYRNNRSLWERERDRLFKLLERRVQIYSRMWVSQMMYNRFDTTIDHWAQHYNRLLAPAANLDPNIVKSMFYQESRIGTSGQHLMPAPYDWNSESRHPIRSRFNLGQAIDSWGPQQWLMIREMSPSFYKHYKLDALEAGRRWLGMSNSDYASHSTFLRALREFFEFRSGAGENLMGTPGRDLHEDYAYWIRTAIRWVFVKYQSLSAPTWSEAVRAFNGGGAEARRYRDQVMARVGSRDAYSAELKDDTDKDLKSEPLFKLNGSVGNNGNNRAQDVTSVRARLYELGFNWATLDENGKPSSDFINAIKLFQGIVTGKATWENKDGLIEPGKSTERWLQAENAPRWIALEDGSTEGPYHYLKADSAKGDDRWCTDWTRDVIVAAGKEYKRLVGTDDKPTLTVHELSASKGKASGHLGHRTGCMFDVRIPKLDGGIGTNINEDQYDRDTTRKILKALRAQPLLQRDRLYFNDQVLIDEGLCNYSKEHDNHIHARIKPPKQGKIKMFSAPTVDKTIPANLLGAPGLVDYLQHQDLMNTHRMDQSGARFVVIDADSHKMTVIANTKPGKTIDDVVLENPNATAIINGTYFSEHLPMQSEGYLRENGSELPTSLPAKEIISESLSDDDKKLNALIEKAKGEEYLWVGTGDGNHLLYGSGHPPPENAKSAIGRLLRKWHLTKYGIDVTDIFGVSIIGYNPLKRAILLFSRFGLKESPSRTAITTGIYDIQDIEQRMRSSGFTQFAYLDGGGSVALYVKQAGVLIRGARHKAPQIETETVTSYIAFTPVS